MLDITDKEVELSDSRYRNFDILRNGNEEEFIESWRDINIPESENDRYYQVESGDKNRLDLIAYKYYNKANLWWVIALANDIRNPLEIEVGEILRIPATDVLYGYGGVLS